jgi:hypothetical protein
MCMVCVCSCVSCASAGRVRFASADECLGIMYVCAYAYAHAQVCPCYARVYAILRRRDLRLDLRLCMRQPRQNKTSILSCPRPLPSATANSQPCRLHRAYPEQLTARHHRPPSPIFSSTFTRSLSTIVSQPRSGPHAMRFWLSLASASNPSTSGLDLGTLGYASNSISPIVGT